MVPPWGVSVEPAQPRYGDGHLCTWYYCPDFDHEGSYLVRCGQCQAVGFSVVANETMTHVVVASQEADEPLIVDGVDTQAEMGI